MNTLNNYYFRNKQKTQAYSKIVSSMQIILVVICVYLVFGLLFMHVYANTDTGDIDPYQTRHGSVWLLPDNGVYIEALQMQIDVDYEITGAIARAKVKQRFRNSSELWAEGVYVFPLPETAAVDHFRILIGERIIEDQIEERVITKKIYEDAKSAGEKASLIEQQRPNVFTTSLANIAPGESFADNRTRWPLPDRPV